MTSITPSCYLTVDGLRVEALVLLLLPLVFDAAHSVVHVEKDHVPESVRLELPLLALEHGGLEQLLVESVDAILDELPDEDEPEVELVEFLFTRR